MEVVVACGRQVGLRRVWAFRAWLVAFWWATTGAALFAAVAPLAGAVQGGIAAGLWLLLWFFVNMPLWVRLPMLDRQGARELVFSGVGDVGALLAA